jgi:hypothetical protein
MTLWATNGREQAQHMLCDNLVGRAINLVQITRRAIQHRRAPISRWPNRSSPWRRRARNVFATAVLADLHGQLTPFYSDIGRLSIDAELMKGGPSDVGQFQSG